ncbi:MULTISPECIES: alpha/beta hydrolase [Enterococcus]|uniref:alpha/beta hydrolase n=1 Tax=Enterococcus TaxID=1350 RepID=UPI00232ADDC3|nr:alpha/beta hydrolase family protein [Enterococcus dispar]WCG32032.1 alpha/beta hydrolase family protein [Enterococcus dispar]
MTICQLNFKSQILDLSTSVKIYLPDTVDVSEAPVLYLLHGWSDDCNAWFNQTNLARQAQKYPFVIVMPQVGLSYYTDMAAGGAYFTFLTQELPQKMKQWFQIEAVKEKMFVAGLSMGGYGAFKWALTYPDQFNAAASLSGALDVVNLWRRPERKKQLAAIFGDIRILSKSNNNLFNLLPHEMPASIEETYFLQMCGTEDFIYQDNQNFLQRAQNVLPFFEYQESPGNHDWAYWEKAIAVVLQRFAEIYTRKTKNKY